MQRPDQVAQRDESNIRRYMGDFFAGGIVIWMTI
jgi:hypothetical protein